MAGTWRYEGPMVTVDALIVRDGKVLLIERRFPPPGWALPGGFVDKDETVEQAVCRETLEETGLVVVKLRQLHCYSDPKRDPRQHTAGVIFEVETMGEPVAGDDAGQCRWFPLDALPTLAFDHGAIAEDFKSRRYPGGAFEPAPMPR